MAIKKEQDDKVKTHSSALFLIVSFLLLVSIAISVIGLLNGKKSQSTDTDQGSNENRDELQEEPITDLFQKEFSEESGSEGVDEFYVNDPFKEICESTQGDDKPAISSYTVCYR